MAETVTTTTTPLLCHTQRSTSFILKGGNFQSFSIFSAVFSKAHKPTKHLKIFPTVLGKDLPHTLQSGSWSQNLPQHHIQVKTQAQAGKKEQATSHSPLEMLALSLLLLEPSLTHAVARDYTSLKTVISRMFWK